MRFWGIHGLNPPLVGAHSGTRGGFNPRNLVDALPRQENQPQEPGMGLLILRRPNRGWKLHPVYINTSKLNNGITDLDQSQRASECFSRLKFCLKSFSVADGLSGIQLHGDS